MRFLGYRTFVAYSLMKHPDPTTPEVKDLPKFEGVTELPGIHISAEVIARTAKKLSGSGGPSGVQGLDLKRWLLGYKGASENLCQAMGVLANWLANDKVPWARYRVLMSGRLVAIDKNPGVRPVGIGDAIRGFIAKCILEVTKGEAVLACGSDQLCAGLQNGCKSGIHAMHKLFEEMRLEEFWGFLLIDARNAFNEGNRIVMLYVVWHMWPSGATFCMNC